MKTKLETLRDASADDYGKEVCMGTGNPWCRWTPECGMACGAKCGKPLLDDDEIVAKPVTYLTCTGIAPDSGIDCPHKGTHVKCGSMDCVARGTRYTEMRGDTRGIVKMFDRKVTMLLEYARLFDRKNAPLLFYLDEMQKVYNRVRELLDNVLLDNTLLSATIKGSKGESNDA